MPDFALYYIPAADHPLYRAGSELLGYDLRAEKLLPVENPSRDGVPGFDLSWVRDSQQYGFHMTIGHAIQFQADRLGAIEAETEAILNLFDAGKQWELTPCAGTAYTAIAPQWACLLRYDANQAFLMLHAMVVARLSLLGIGTPQLDKFMAGETNPSVHSQHRLMQYFYQHILDDYYPHFTLFNPLPVDEIDSVRTGVMAVVPEPEAMTVETLCLLVRPDGEKHYRIHREFSRKRYPQALTVTTS